MSIEPVAVIGNPFGAAAPWVRPVAGHSERRAGFRAGGASAKPDFVQCTGLYVAPLQLSRDGAEPNASPGIGKSAADFL